MWDWFIMDLFFFLCGWEIEIGKKREEGKLPNNKNDEQINKEENIYEYNLDCAFPYPVIV